jgi:hypothetical protein
VADWTASVIANGFSSMAIPNSSNVLFQGPIDFSCAAEKGGKSVQYDMTTFGTRSPKSSESLEPSLQPANPTADAPAILAKTDLLSTVLPAMIHEK